MCLIFQAGQVFRLGPGQSCITTELALLLTQEEGPVNKLFSQRHAYLAAWDFYFLFSLFNICFSMYSFFLFDFDCSFEDQWIRHWPSEVLGALQGGAIPHGDDVSTSKCSEHFGRCILKDGGLPSFVTG